MPVIDASFLLDLEHGRPDAHRTLKAYPEEEWIVPYQAALEYLVGVDDTIPAMRALESGYRIVHSNREILLEAARLFIVSERKGRRPSWSDLHIAAVAALLQMPIVTADARAFGSMEIQTHLYRDEKESSKKPHKSV